MDVRGSDAIIVGARVFYDHPFFTNPKIGRFGDTGGFHMRVYFGFVL
jgi:hypothetical protein